MEEDPKDTRGFTAKSIDTMSIAKALDMYPGVKPEFSRLTVQHKRQAEISATLPDKGKHYAGTVWVFVRCGLLCQCFGIVSSCELLDYWRTRKEPSDWKKAFMEFIPMHRYYQRGGDVIGVPKQVSADQAELLRLAK